MTPHPIQRRYLAEDLVRVRPADEQRRYVASQRSGRIDPNPHQIEAVVFALKRISEGGCILADEVRLERLFPAGGRTRSPVISVKVVPIDAGGDSPACVRCCSTHRCCCSPQ